MAVPTSRLQQVLREHSYSLTHSRQIVFAALQGQEPQTMRELVARCKNIDRASVYRTIALFEELGIVQRLQIGWKYKLELSDQYAPHHHHATCLNCGKMVAMPEDSSLERYILRMAGAQNFIPSDHQLEIRGICPECQHVLLADK